MLTPESKIELGFYHPRGLAGYRGGARAHNEKERPSGRSLP